MNSKASESDGKRSAPWWRTGVGATMFAAFLAIAAFGATAAGSAIYALHQLGDRFEIVDERLPRTAFTLDMSRSAERIVAAAPSLLAAADARDRAAINTSLDEEVRKLRAALAALSANGAAHPAADIEAVVSILAADLKSLGDLVSRRLSATERLAALRGSVSSNAAAIERLLAPWIMIVESEIGAIAGDTANGALFPGTPIELAARRDLERSLRSAQAGAISIAEMLGEASTAEQPERLAVLIFQVNRAVDDLASIVEEFDPRLGAMLLPAVDAFRELVTGPASVPAQRREELALLEEGSKLVAALDLRSAELIAAVAEIGSSASADIRAAIENAMLLQQRSIWFLILTSVAAFAASALIAWRYVGGNVVRRLNAMSQGTRAIAAGDLEALVPMEGADEITTLAEAVETFRLNTRERDALLIEKARTADRLENEVGQRTDELSRSMRVVEEKSRELEDANRFKSRFLASASHDLRQPLHALNLFVAQLREARDLEERQRLVSQVDKAVGSMNDLFDALLDMAKLDAGVLEPNLRSFAVRPLLARLRRTFSDQAEGKGLKLSVVESNVWVRSDPILLERILNNLISNAVRYTPEGAIVVGCRRRGPEARIEVWDTGVGIREDDISSILDEFVRLGHGGDGGKDGLGLGLSIVSRLVDLLGHRLEIMSRVGKGSRFTIIVPVVAEQRPATAGASAVNPADTTRGKCVLVVDDDPLSLDGLGGILRSWGCHVISAAEPHTARCALTASAVTPNLIISDLHLGGGWSVLEFINDVRADAGALIPAFLISGDTTSDSIRSVRARGFHLLHKPVAPMRLRAMVNRMTLEASGAEPPA